MIPHGESDGKTLVQNAVFNAQLLSAVASKLQNVLEHCLCTCFQI